MSQHPIRRLIVIGTLAAMSIAATALAPTVAGAAPKTTPTAMDSKSKRPTKTIVGVASSNPELSTFVAALKAAGLVKAANGKGPFTVFAPTNAAFAKIPADQLNALLADKAALAALLQYHVIRGKVPSSALKATQTVPTIDGDTIKIDVARTPTTVTDSQGNTSDLPVGDTPITDSQGNTLTITVADDGSATIDSGGNTISASGDGSSSTINGVTVTVGTPQATITDGQGNVSNIVKTDIKAKNGVIHLIDAVLLPAPKP